MNRNSSTTKPHPRSARTSAVGSRGRRQQTSRTPNERSQTRKRMPSREASSRTQRKKTSSVRASSTRATTRSSLMQYASDNRFVRAVYAITSGTHKWVFVVVVALIVVAGLYFPLRNVYSAWRTGDILTRQLAIRSKYNESVQADVDKLLSTDGIADVARDNLGLVSEGEQAIDVIGLDEAVQAQQQEKQDDDAQKGDDTSSGAASSSSTDSSTTNSDATDDTSDKDTSSTTQQDNQATSSAEVKAAEQKVAEDAPWYIKMLDTIFFYTGVDGQKVTSTGGSTGSAQTS